MVPVADVPFEETPGPEVPPPAADADATYRLGDAKPTRKPGGPRPQRESEERSRPSRRPSASPRAVDRAERYKHILADKSNNSWREWAYLGLVVTLVPLAFSLLGKGEDPAGVRLQRTIENAPREVQQRVDRIMDAVGEGKADPDQLFEVLPGGRIEGSHLPRKTFVHFLYALLAAGVFFALALLVFPSESGHFGHLLLVGSFTGTVGVGFLFVAQFLAEWASGHILVSRNIFIMVVFWVAWAIGFSYRAALDPDFGFLSSFFGFTFGVGLCEEVCKALPLIWYYRNWNNAGWREARTWGFASGVGFGVAEAIMYSSNHYNGISPAGIYLVRFVSCIALHAIWSTAAALFIFKHREMIQGDFEWYDYIPRVIFLVAIPMVLHGLYDTALKKDMNAVALIVALVSLAWLAWCIETSRGSEDEEVPARRGTSYA